MEPFDVSSVIYFMVSRVLVLFLVLAFSLPAADINPAASPPLPGLTPALAQENSVPAVRWKAQLKDGSSCSRIDVLDNGTILAARGFWAYELFSPAGKSLFAFPTDRVKQDHWRPLFGPDGSRYMLEFHSTTNPPAYYWELKAYTPDGSQSWTKRLPDGISINGEAYMEVTESGIFLVGYSAQQATYPQQRKAACHRLDLNGNLLESVDLDSTDRMYSCQPLENGNYISVREGQLVCFGPDGQQAWEYTAYGFRREFTVFPDGTAYALIKAPERLIKVDADGQLAWECNLTEHATGELNSYYDFGHAFGGYVDVASDGTAYVCTAYSELAAVSKDGEFLWSVKDPRAGNTGSRAGFSLDYLAEPAVAPNGTIYLCADRSTLMAVSAQGRMLFTDDRYARLSTRAAFGADGTVYIASAGWLYALDPGTSSAEAVLAEQESVLEAERQQQAEREREWEQEEEQLQARLAEQAEKTGRDPQELLGEYYGGWTPESEPAPAGLQIADRTVVAAEIIRGLLAYYADHGEWPPYLLGVKYPDDPLIAGGYLEAYPLAWPQPGCWCGMSAVNTDETQHVRWCCAVSTPGEPETPALDERGAPRDASPRQRQRCLSIGPNMYDNSGWSFFGYQRGEWLGRNEREAWLWFYGSNIWPEQNNPIPWNSDNWRAMEYFDLFRDFSEFGRRGFDLLNDETGELLPDGDRDGICLLYKLKDGELAEVIRADGI